MRPAPVVRIILNSLKASALTAWLLLLISLWSLELRAEIQVQVQVEGIPPLLELNVRLFLSVEQQKAHALLNEGRLRRLHNKAEQEIRLALQPFGYYLPVIHAELTGDDRNGWTALYRIDRGPAMKVEVFDLKVSDQVREDTEFSAYLDKLPLKVGDTLNHQLYESIKSDLLRLAVERGYFDAVFNQASIEVDLNRYRAHIELDFDSGLRYRYGQIDATQTVLNPELLQRYIRFSSGEPFLSSDLISLRQAFNDSDFFNRVEVLPGEPEPETLQVPIDINLIPRKPNRYNLGLGYGTDTGARGSLSWEKPMLNDAGHRFKTELDVQEIGNSLTAHYSVPVFDPRTDRLVYSAGLVNEETDTSDSRVETIGISLNQNRGQWRQKLSLEYQHEDFTVAEISDTTTLLLPGASWSRTWGGNLIFTLDGIRLDLDVQGANEHWLSDISFLQMQGGIKFIKHLGASNRLIARGRLGSTSTDDFDVLPSSLRFFAGGAQSVRGYAYQSLGPETDDGDVEGGKHLMVGSLEIDHRLQGNWGVALFYDTGNAINDLDDDLENGAGFGFRWKSPVGPVRIDFASAISRDGDPWRLHINIGPDL